MAPRRFGEDFELDARAYELRRSGESLKLERIPMEILLLLTERRGELVTREQIAERVWGKEPHLDTDNSINGAIRKIRQILRDDREEPRFIQTVTGLGYRFIAPVNESEAPASKALPGQRRPARAWLVPSLALLALLVLGAVLYLVGPRSATTGPPPRVMIAVLPLQNLTGDERQDYFSDGLTEEMITQLGNRDPAHLGVIARTSVMHYKNTTDPLDRIERELGVQYVLTGSVRRDANHVRVTAQLIRARDQSQIWARQYDRELAGLLTLQDEIGREITDEIQSSLGEGSQKPVPPATSPAPGFEAYDLYLRGAYQLNKRTVPEIEAAIRYFREATRLDSTFARAYAAQSDAYVLLAGYSQRPAADILAQARAAAVKAVALGPSLAEAHTALALVVQTYDWDWQTAEREYRQAIALNPNYATAHHWYAEHLMWLGRFDEALQESERARQLDPLSLIIASDNGAILFYARQYDRAIEKWRSVLGIDPEFPRAHMIDYAYAEKGMTADAVASVERRRAMLNPSSYWAELAYIYGRTGRTTLARRALGELQRASRRAPIQAGAFAAVYAAQGNKEETLKWLQRAADEHSMDMTTLKVNPAFDLVRGDPRFQHLLVRVGLAR